MIVIYQICSEVRNQHLPVIHIPDADARHNVIHTIDQPTLSFALSLKGMLMYDIVSVARCSVIALRFVLFHSIAIR